MYGKQTLSVFSPPSLTCKGGSNPSNPPPTRLKIQQYTTYMEELMCFRLWSHYTAGYLFMAPREAILYIVWTPTCIQHVTQVHFRDRRGTARRSVSEITPPQPFLRVNRSPNRHGFLGGAEAIWYGVNIALTFIHFPDNWKFQAVSSIDEFEMNESEMMPSDSNTCMFVF